MAEGIVLALIVGVVFVNGWTDAPNAIACAVSTGAMRYRAAAWMAGVCNLIGLLVSYLIGGRVAETVLSLANFGGDPHAALIALFGAMASIILFAVAVWWFGIPTSESHALISALTGAALALGGSVSLSAWGKVAAGLVLSVALGYGQGWLLCKLLGRPLSALREKTLGRFQIFAAGGMAFMHGAQDGQKFVAIFILADLYARGRYPAGAINPRDHLAVLLLCGLTMALGTSLGGGRIVRLVGSQMVRLGKPEGVCADLGGAGCLLAASLLGIPVSTTHTKTTAMMGAGAAMGDDRVDGSTVGGIAFAWAVTFPACFVLGWGITQLAIRV
ncbi:MAG: inorganic phosphate transporter [Oscillospiraceae bacterium]|nr:inorganic phosphate transporter [Oscillospiraceae bacterium]